jgi:hypothetical protein
MFVTICIHKSVSMCMHMSSASACVCTCLQQVHVYAHVSHKVGAHVSVLLVLRDD